VTDTPSVSAKSTKKVKLEAAKTTTNAKKGNVNNDDDDDDDIVVLDPLEVNTLFCAPVSTDTATTSTATGDGDDIELVGTKNRVFLPRMRQHCTEKAFQGNTGYSSAARKAINSQFCSHC
jgi:hypothetical protein